MDVSHIIEPDRHGIWIAAGFIVALLALVLGFAAIHKINTVFVGTQEEIIALNNKIESLKGKATNEQPAQQPAAPAPAEK